MEDRSLDEFLNDGEESDSSSDAEQASQEPSGPSPESGEGSQGETESEVTPDEESVEPEEAAEPVDSEVVEPPSELPDEPEPATASWTPDGAACEACSETASRLWDDEGQQVCRSCKEW